MCNQGHRSHSTVTHEALVTQEDTESCLSSNKHCDLRHRQSHTHSDTCGGDYEVPQETAPGVSCHGWSCQHLGVRVSLRGIWRTYSPSVSIFLFVPLSLFPWDIIGDMDLHPHHTHTHVTEFEIRAQSGRETEREKERRREK